VEKSVLGVNNGQLFAAMPEGDESCVESSVADWVVMSTKSREPGCTFSWTVRQADNIEVSVSPEVRNAELAVVDGGEHVEQFST
jgi:hypothetical protein